MKKIFLFLKLILRSKFIFKTPKRNDLIIFDEESVNDLNVCLTKFNFIVLQTRFESTDRIYFSFKILRKISKNFFKGNLFTAYLISLIELIDPKVVITTADHSYKFSEIAKVLEKKISFIAIQCVTRSDFIDYNYGYRTKQIKKNFLNKYYFPNLLCLGDYEKDLYKELGIKVKNIYPIGNLRMANCLHYIKTNNDSLEKYNSDICLIFQIADLALAKKENDQLFSYIYQDSNHEKGLAKVVKYTIKFCIKNKMKLVIPCKRDKKILPDAHKLEIEFLKRNLTNEEFDYAQSNLLEKTRHNFTSYRAVLDSKITIGTYTTLLRDKLGVGGKILSCNLTKSDRYNFPINGICTLNNCTYEEFENRVLEIYSMPKEIFFSKMEKKPDYVMHFSKNHSTIDLIRERLLHLGVNQH